MSNPPSKVNDLAFRRTWNKDDYEKKGDGSGESSGDERRIGDAQRSLLKQRDYKVDLDSKLGKTIVLTDQKLMAAAGYYCKVCDCTVKDSMSYLDHINGKKHQRNLGMSMKVERSSTDQIKDKLAALSAASKRKHEGDVPSPSTYARKEGAHTDKKSRADGDDPRGADGRGDKPTPGARKQEAKSDDNDLEAEVDPELAKMMGFSGFGGSKK